MSVAAHIFLLRDVRVLLLRRRNIGHEDGNYGVAGHVGGGEEIAAVMIREAREEAGIAIAPEDLRVVGAMHRRASGEERIDFFLAAAAWSGAIENREPDRCDELAWFPADALPCPRTRSRTSASPSSAAGAASGSPASGGTASGSRPDGRAAPGRPCRPGGEDHGDTGIPIPLARG